MKKFTTTFAILITSLFATFANASLIQTFDLTGNNEGVENTFNFAAGDISLEISAWTTSFASDGSQQEAWQQLGGDFGVYKGSTGLGVFSNDNDGYDLDGGSSDNFAADPDEGLLLQFSQRVYLNDFIISDLGDNDDINLALVNFISPSEIVLTDVFLDIGGLNRTQTYDGFNLLSGQAFMIWVDGGSDDVRFDGLSVTAVNEPHSLLLLGLALVGFSLRRKAK